MTSIRNELGNSCLLLSLNFVNKKISCGKLPVQIPMASKINRNQNWKQEICGGRKLTVLHYLFTLHAVSRIETLWAGFTNRLIWEFSYWTEIFWEKRPISSV